ncbi:MAG: PASTA domain-containing protein [Treponema sp.]|nr:PASTA domain-containing protein [Treponema sp.]
MTNFFSKLKERLFHINFHNIFEDVQANGKALTLTVISTLIVVALACFAVFLINVKGYEQVLVPDVVGKDLPDALLELQAKELYPKIQLRYSDAADDKGKIIEQEPSAGAIRKGYSRVSLVVSRGVVVDRVGNYIGENIEAVRMNLQTLFAGSPRQLITIASPQYKADTSEAGTILEQDPPEGTSITDTVTMHFVVSRGPSFENTRVPNLVGSSVNDVLQQMSRTRLTFDFTSHTASGAEQAGTVVRMQTFDSELVQNYTRVAAEFAFPPRSVNGDTYGIFEDTLPTYLYPVSVKLIAIPEDGEQYTLVSFSSLGGSVTVPYAVPSGTELALYVVASTGEREHKRIVVR